MGTIAEKLTYLNTTKTMLKDSLNKFGSSILSTDTFRSYDTKLNEIYNKLPKITQSGAGFTLENVQNGLVDDFKMIGTDLYQNQLPSEYTAVEYLQSNNECYIDTGINADYKLSLKMKMAYLGSGISFMGAIANTGSSYIRHHFSFNNSNIGFYIGETNTAYDIISVDNNYHNYDIDVYNKKITIDNTNQIINYNNFDLGVNYYLFARNNNNTNLTYGQYKIAYCKMYYEDNLVRDFAPCYRNSDNVAGLYDFVTNTFFTNQGTGTFTVGNNITLPNPNYPQEIKVVEGRQVITDKGKNLLNKNLIDLGYAYTYGTTGEVPHANANNTRATISPTNAILVEPNTSYTINHDSTWRIAIAEMKNDLESLGDTGWLTYNQMPYTITTKATTKYLAFNLSKADNTAITNEEFQTFLNSNIIICQETSINNYEPYYNPVSYNIDLQLANIYLAKIPNTDYKNRIYKNNGNWYFEENVRKYIFNSERVLAVNDYQSSSTGTSKNGTYSIVISDIGINVSNDKMMSTEYSYELNSNVTDNYSAQTNMTNNTFCLRQETNDRIYFKCSDYANKTASEISELIENESMYYALATPVTTQITNTTLINQLEAISVHTGTNIITISNDNNIIPEIEITRLKELEKLS